MEINVLESLADYYNRNKKTEDIHTFSDVYDPEDEVTAESLYSFDPDKSIKKLIKALDPDTMIAVLNELCNTNFPKGCTIKYLSTEHTQATGGKTFISSDLVMEITPPAGYKGLKNFVKGSPLHWKKLDHSYIVALELQTSIKTGIGSSNQEPIGFRLFLYAINTVEKRIFKIKQKKKILYVLPKGATIYMVAGMPEAGVDEVYLQFDRFRVRKHKFSASKGDALVLEFPYVNILGMDIHKLDKSVYNFLLTVYLYRFRQKPQLMLEDDFEEILTIVEKGLENFEGDENLKNILNEIHKNLKRDLRIRIKKSEKDPKNKNKDYRKADETMQQLELSYGERKLMSYRKIVGRDYQTQIQEKDEQHKLEKDTLLQEKDKQHKLELKLEKEIIAKNLLLSSEFTMSNEAISKVTKVPLTRVEELRAEIERG